MSGSDHALPAARFSDAVIVGDIAYLSGQGPVRGGRILLGTIEEETVLTLRNLIDAAVRVGGSADSVVQCVCYLSQLSDVDAFNRVYTGVFRGALPARVLVAAELQHGIKVEVHAVVAVGAGVPKVDRRVFSETDE